MEHTGRKQRLLRLTYDGTVAFWPDHPLTEYGISVQ